MIFLVFFVLSSIALVIARFMISIIMYCLYAGSVLCFFVVGAAFGARILRISSSFFAVDFIAEEYFESKSSGALYPSSLVEVP